MLQELTDNLNCQFQDEDASNNTDNKETGTLKSSSSDSTEPSEINVDPVANQTDSRCTTSTTSLTSTWELCTGTSKTSLNEPNPSMPDPPLAIVNFFKALQTREVQEYIRNFIDCYEKTNKEQETSSYYVNNLQTNLIRPSNHMSHQDNNFSYNSSTTMHDNQSPYTMNSSYGTFSASPEIHKETFCADSHSIPYTHPYMYNTPDMSCSQEDTHSFHSHTQSATSMTELNKSFHKNIDHTRPSFQNQGQAIHFQNSQSNTPRKYDAVASNPKSPIRRSPRKLYTPEATPGRKSMSQSSLQENSGSSKSATPQSDKVKLLAHEDLMIERRMLRKATSAADKCAPQKAAFTLTSKLLPHFFTVEVLAQSRGQGLRKVKDGDLRPVLDPKTIDIIREYVENWLKRNGKPQSDTQFNDAITEKISYSRKLLKKKL